MSPLRIRNQVDSPSDDDATPMRSWLMTGLTVMAGATVVGLILAGLTKPPPPHAAPEVKDDVTIGVPVEPPGGTVSPEPPAGSQPVTTGFGMPPAAPRPSPPPDVPSSPKQAHK